MEKKKGLFGFRQKEKPDLEAEDRSPTLLFYFKLLWRKASKLLSLNLMMDFMVLPLVAIFLIYLFGRQTMTAESAAFSPLLGVSLFAQTDGVVGPSGTLIGSLFGVFGGLHEAAFPSTAAIVVMIVLIALLAITWGWQNVGATYNLRSLVRGDSCFLFSDYFYAIKKNWKQGLIFGLVDFTALAVLLFDLYYYITSFTDPAIIGENAFWYYAMLFLSVAVFIVYILMRFYIYLMMITFDLPIKKLLKNALIFSMLGIKRNFMALLGIVLVGGLNIALIIPSLSIGFTLTLILPFFYLPAFAGFTATYAAYPNIKRYMIDGDPTLTAYTPPEDEEEAEESEEADVTPPPPAAD